MKKSLALLIIAAAALVGCQGETKYLTKRHYIPLDIATAMTKPVEAPIPPDMVEFVGSTSTPIVERLEKRVDLLVPLSIDLYMQLDACNAQLYEIEKFSIFSKQRVEELNKKEVYRDKVD